ncbi:TfoX/Sxy family protein [Caulobacter sp. 17J65-9]|uniref:TfoX/Sxy family protein n=1 Tax=Caulobacter sp. 17J65-9 TaxID=2709382 RepID=UPI0013CCC978|nr:TfoX/Sxy family protein [Caulobacter sp. 17J65-9]NEX92933.1 TfoX/Sxy family protein [Caulobacter sp. 17J65-9]
MSVSDAFGERARDLLAVAPDLRFRKMFGEIGAYSGDLFFALVADEAVWLKTDDVNEADFVEAGVPLFVYGEKDGKPMSLRYRRLPDAAWDDEDEARRWIGLGLDAARRAKAGKAGKGKKKPVKVDLGPGPWDG